MLSFSRSVLFFDLIDPFPLEGEGTIRFDSLAVSSSARGLLPEGLTMFTMFLKAHPTAEKPTLA